MTTRQIEFILENNKWPFTWSEFWDHYYILIAPLLVTVAPIGLFVSGIIHNGASETLPFLIFFLAWLMIGVGFFRFTLSRIESERQFAAIPLTAAEKILIPQYLFSLGWAVVEKTEDYILARTKISWISWGEDITLVFSDDKILFNSRPYGQPITFNRDKTNLRKFESQFAISQHRS